MLLDESHAIVHPQQSDPVLYFVPATKSLLGSSSCLGCICFVYDLSPGKDKLVAKSLKCVFLDYSSIQKGYHCYCPQLQRYLVFADVTFFESNPFFSETVVSHAPLADQPVVPIPPVVIDPPPLIVY